MKKIVDGEEREVEKKWTYFELGPYEYLSFSEYEKLTLQIGAGYRKLGLNKEDRIHIFAATSAHWLATAHGAASQSMAIVTAYDTLGEEGLKHSLIATEAKAIFLDPHLLPTLLNPLKEAKAIKYVIWNSQNEVKQKNIDDLKKAHEHLTILSFEELRKLGEQNPVNPVPPSPKDLCCIMYTSGSTGPPKGVPLKHEAVLASSKLGKSQDLSAANLNSRWCQCHCRAIPRTWRRPLSISTPRAYTRIRLRERLHLLGWNHGVWKSEDSVGHVCKELQG